MDVIDARKAKERGARECGEAGQGSAGKGGERRGRTRQCVHSAGRSRLSSVKKTSRLAVRMRQKDRQMTSREERETKSVERSDYVPASDMIKINP